MDIMFRDLSLAPKSDANRSNAVSFSLLLLIPFQFPGWVELLGFDMLWGLGGGGAASSSL